VPLPIAREVNALAALHGQRRYAAHLIAIGDAAALLQEFDAQHPAAAPNDLARLSLPLSECKFEASRNNA
jgi:hypothetical protein